CARGVPLGWNNEYYGLDSW
nr:immunoglobulin heavy chain junction region [Macaca mulatta]MOX93060.1 immunoglobulin heavy chain junction region [Macaca mulatta]MOX93293.1 immunoglobulin heavy chain junction region [Macaca mulatta]MOX93916.1 immunoglobulin heavy chain junction region [Macaca mulatta]MOX96883.1 immunoglobulin heavy chain junction region [Macaca mulatta]